MVTIIHFPEVPRDEDVEDDYSTIAVSSTASGYTDSKVKASEGMQMLSIVNFKGYYKLSFVMCENLNLQQDHERTFTQSFINLIIYTCYLIDQV